MGNVSLKVLEKSVDLLFKNGYEPWTWLFGDTNVTSRPLQQLNPSLRSRAKHFSTFEAKFRISEWPCNILYSRHGNLA